MSGWNEVTLAEVSSRVNYGYTASASDDPDLIRFVRITDIAQEYLDWESVPGCSVGDTEFNKYELATDDIVVARTGATVGYAKRIRKHPRAVFASYLVRFRLAPEVNPSFVGAIVESQDYKTWVLQNAGGAAQPNASAKVLGAYPFLLPDRDVQDKIGAVFDTIADLLENNRRRVELLEEMARAIYREWFVKFRYPGHEDVPLVDSALGPIPEGWSVGTVGHLCSRIQAGATPRRSNPEFWNEPSVDWYKTGELTDGVLLGSEEKLSEAGLKAGRAFEPETILMAIYGSPTVGRLGLLASRASANQAALGLVANPSVCTTEFLWFKLESLRGYLNQIAQGAAQQNVSKAKVMGCQVVIPPRGVIESFTVNVAPCWRLSHQLANQAAALESLLDRLLPKLVTGQIDVSQLDLDSLTPTDSFENGEVA